MNLKIYFSDFHSYFFSNRDKVYKILNQLKQEESEMYLETENTDSNIDNNNNYTDFYFFYIQKFNTIKKRSNFSFYNNNIIVPRNLDLLTGLNFSNYDIDTEFKIFIEYGNTKKKINSITLNEKNKNDIFLPINNINFFPYFLIDENIKLSIYSNKKLNKRINLVYLKLHRDIIHRFKNYGSFLINIKNNSFINIYDYNLEIKYIKKNKIQSNEFVFFYDTEKYYGLKILKFFKRVMLTKFLKQFLYEEYDIYKDITNIILKYC